MRNPHLFGNWKMNLDRDGAVELSRGLRDQLSQTIGSSSSLVLGVCPSHPFLSLVEEVLRATSISVGGQDLYYEKEGAFTGEVSPVMLKSLGCEVVIVGHSERRKYFGDTNQIVNKKVRTALDFDLTPIVCVGETLEEREDGRAREVVSQQLTQSLNGLDKSQAAKVILAYEPVWAIGTGKTASPEDAEEMHQHMRDLLLSMWDQEISSQCPLLYGGSVKPHNARQLGTKKNIDGFLVGGASLQASDFLEIGAKLEEVKRG